MPAGSEGKNEPSPRIVLGANAKPNVEEAGMAPKVGYLIPTRESVMQGRPAAGPLLTLAERAAEVPFDSIWIGDSLLDRPRHEPLVMLAGGWWADEMSVAWHRRPTAGAPQPCAIG